MSILKAVTGAWRGTYSYDAAERLPHLAPVPFALMLQQDWLGRFTGMVQDGPGGMPERGTIEGRFSDPCIEFIKQMPVCYVLSREQKQIPLRQLLAELGESSPPEIAHKPIRYQGTFTDAHHAQGTWVIRAGSFPLQDGRVLRMKGATGTWLLKSAA